MYSLTNTCSIDSALFCLYFLYKTDDNIAGEFDSASVTSPYATLAKLFYIVEKEGWDAARIFWLLNFDILQVSDRQPKDIFGSLDERVFCFIKNEQRHSNDITCSRTECTERRREYSTTELRIL